MLKILYLSNINQQAQITFTSNAKIKLSIFLIYLVTLGFYYYWAS